MNASGCMVPCMAYTLIREAVSHDTVEALEQLLEAARGGDIVGMAFAIALRERRFITDATGTCYADPTRARGLVATLDDELSQMIRTRADDTTL